jgi:hypothetical protein
LTREVEITEPRREVQRLFAKPPGGKELLADEMVFQRVDDRQDR